MVEAKPIGEPVGISDNHVLTEYDKFLLRSDVIHPGVADAPSGTVIGEIAGYVRLHEGDLLRPLADTNYADVAWCRPKNNITVDFSTGGNLLVGEVDWSGRWADKIGSRIAVTAIVKPGKPHCTGRSFQRRRF